MNINTNNIVPISETNQHFSRVARMVEQNGEVYIFKKVAIEFYYKSHSLHPRTTLAEKSP